VSGGTQKPVWYAVSERNITLKLGNEFGRWWAEHGHMFHRYMADGYANWAAQTFPRATDDE